MLGDAWRAKGSPRESLALLEQRSIASYLSRTWWWWETGWLHFLFCVAAAAQTRSCIRASEVKHVSEPRSRRWVWRTLVRWCHLQWALMTGPSCFRALRHTLQHLSEADLTHITAAGDRAHCSHVFYYSPMMKPTEVKRGRQYISSRAWFHCVRLAENLLWTVSEFLSRKSSVWIVMMQKKKPKTKQETLSSGLGLNYTSESHFWWHTQSWLIQMKSCRITFISSKPTFSLLRTGKQNFRWEIWLQGHSVGKYSFTTFTFAWMMDDPGQLWCHFRT